MKIMANVLNVGDRVLYTGKPATVNDVYTEENITGSGFYETTVSLYFDDGDCAIVTARPGTLFTLIES